MDESKAAMLARAETYTGAAIEMRRLSGAAITRILHPPGQSVPPHRHDWPVLALYRLGAYRELTEEGESVALNGPSVVFHPSGAMHADEIGETGLETLSMSFDPAWLSAEARPALPTRSRLMTGGAAANGGRALAAIWLSDTASDAEVRAQTSYFVLTALTQPAPRAAPAWLDRVSAVLEAGPANTQKLAAELSRHPAWLARAYRALRGEGVGETVRRRRIERATLLLRQSGAALADVAAASGFCDQSHMNRCFGAVLGRTPLQVRHEAKYLATIQA